MQGMKGEYQYCLEQLNAEDNFLSVSGVETVVESLQSDSDNMIYATFKTQKIPADAVFAQEEVDTVKDFFEEEVTTLEEMAGIVWEKTDDLYHITRIENLDIVEADRVDLSPLSQLTYLDINDNEIDTLDISGCDQLEYLNCTGDDLKEIICDENTDLSYAYLSNNYLTPDNIVHLNAEEIVAKSQKVIGEVEDFDADEYEVLSKIAEQLEVDTTQPGEWEFVQWMKQDDSLYHATEIDLMDQKEVGGEINLEQFEYLDKVNFSATEVEKVVLPDCLTTIDNNAFYECENLSEITFGSGVTEFGDNAFYGCKSLACIICPKSLTVIGANAFQECSSLERIYFVGDAPAISEDTFLGSSVGFVAYYLEGSTGWEHENWNNIVKEQVDPFSIYRYPTRNVYYIGDELDLSGLKLLLIKEDGDYQIIEEGYSVSDEVDMNTDGRKTVSITYQDNSVDYIFYVSKIDLRYAYFALSGYQFAYTGRAIRPVVKVVLDGNVLKENVDYTVSYYNDYGPGEAYVYIRGIGKYCGTEYLYYDIIKKPVSYSYPYVKMTKLSKVKAISKGKVSVKWSKNSDGSGYQIQYSTKKNFSKAKTISIKKNKTTSTKIKKLKSKKNYYFRIRTVKKINGVNYYSAWSKAKKVKIK